MRCKTRPARRQRLVRNRRVASFARKRGLPEAFRTTLPRTEPSRLGDASSRPEFAEQTEPPSEFGTQLILTACPQQSKAAADLVHVARPHYAGKKFNRC